MSAEGSEEQRDRDLTASELLIKILEDDDVDKIDAIIVCYHTKNEWVKWKTNTNSAMAVGLLELIKQYVSEGYMSGQDFDSPEADTEQEDEDENE